MLKVWRKAEDSFLRARKITVKRKSKTLRIALSPIRFYRMDLKTSSTLSKTSQRVISAFNVSTPS
jgi:hypothetical protein